MTIEIRPRVVLADDYQPMMVAMMRLLSLKCDIVGQVSTAAQLLKEALTHRPDVIVVDLYLEDENGIDACRQLKSANLDVKIVMVTAEDDPQIRSAALDAGVSVFVSKHMAYAQLLPAILRLCSPSTD